MRNLERLKFQELVDLNDSIETELGQRAAHIRDCLAKLESVRPKSGRRPSSLLGTTVAPKYRGPNGETWAGRGARPLWLRELAGDSKRAMERYRIR